MTSANLIVVLLVGAVVGALGGLGLGGVIHNPLHLGIIAGFLATTAAGLFRNFLVSKGALGPREIVLPGKVILYAIIASIARTPERLKLIKRRASHRRSGLARWPAYSQAS